MPKRIVPLSDTKIRTTKPTDKPIKLFDGGGLFLLVTPTGGKLWNLKYRVDGKESRIALGAYPDVSLAEARQRRDQTKTLLANGVNPSETKKAQKSAQTQEQDTFEVIAREWHAKYAPTWADSHADKIIRRLELFVFPWLGKKPIRSISAPDILSLLRKLEGRGTLDTAHRVKQNCGQVFRYAIATGRADRDPTPDLRGALPTAHKNHYASITDPIGVAQLLRAIDGYQGNFVTVCAFPLPHSFL